MDINRQIAEDEDMTDGTAQPTSTPVVTSHIDDVSKLLPSSAHKY